MSKESKAPSSTDCDKSNVYKLLPSFWLPPPCSESTLSKLLYRHAIRISSFSLLVTGLDETDDDVFSGTIGGNFLICTIMYNK